MNYIEFLHNRDKYLGENHDDFLMHYGVLGQKWGQRHWQNPDGTYTTEGKIRYFGSKKAQAEMNADETKIGSKTSDAKDYLKFRNKMLKERTRSDLNEWYRDKNKYLDKQLVRDAKRVDKQQEKMYKNQLKEWYDNPEDLVSDLNAMYKIGGKPNKIRNLTKDINNESNIKELEEIDQKIGSIAKKSDNPENKYQNEDGSLTKKGYKKFAQSGSSFFREEFRDDLLNSWNKEEANKKIDVEKYQTAEYKRRADVMNTLLNDDSANVKKTLKSEIYNKSARKNMIKMLKWCKENGITEVTPEMMEGNRAGNKYLSTAKAIKRSEDSNLYYCSRLLRTSQVIDTQTDKNVKKFLDNNKNYKEYNEILKEQKEKFNEVCNVKLRELVEKELGVELPHTVINKKTGALALNLTDYINDEKVMKAVQNNMKASIDYGHSNKEIKTLNEKGYKKLQECEKDSIEFAKQYLNSTANEKVPGTFVVNTKTGETSENDLSSAFAYDMLCDLFAPYER